MNFNITKINPNGENLDQIIMEVTPHPIQAYFSNPYRPVLLAFIIFGLIAMAALIKLLIDRHKAGLAANHENQSLAPLQFIHAYWLCHHCRQKFRLADDKAKPLRCPSCGEIGSERASNPNDNMHAHTCSQCNCTTYILDNDSPDFCPYCGHEFQEQDVFE